MNKASFRNSLKSVRLFLLNNSKLYTKCHARNKIKKIFSELLPVDVVAACEKEEALKRSTVKEYSAKMKSSLTRIEKRIQEKFADPDIYAAREDKDALHDDILFCCLAYGFTPSEYVYFHLENKTPEERKTFLPHQMRRIYCFSMNDRAGMMVFANKAKTYNCFAPYFKRDAVLISGPKDFEAFNTFITAHPVFVKKLVVSAGGDGVSLVDVNELGMSAQELFDSMLKSGKCLLEELVRQRPEMAVLNPSSVNTVRCFTLNTRHGTKIDFSFVRCGRSGSFVDNATQGGILAVIDNETGITNTCGADEKGRLYDSHPDTGIVMKGFRIPEWDALVSECKSLASRIPSVRYVGWDMAYTDKGWVMIEGNCMGQQVGQIVTDKGTRADLIEYMRDMDLLVPLKFIEKRSV